MTLLQEKVNRITYKLIKDAMGKKVNNLSKKLELLDWQNHKIMSPGEIHNLDETLLCLRKVDELREKYDKIVAAINELQRQKTALENNKRHVIKEISINFYFNTTDAVTIFQDDVNKYNSDECLSAIGNRLDDIIDILIEDHYKKLEVLTEEIRRLYKS